MIGDRETQLILQSSLLFFKMLEKLQLEKSGTPTYDRLFRIAIRARNRHGRRARNLAPDIMPYSASWDTKEIPEEIKHIRKNIVKGD